MMMFLFNEKMKELTCNGEPPETPFLLEGLSLPDGRLAVDHDRVKDEAVLVPLDLADHVGLGIGRAVVVNDAQTALKGHVDGHLVLCDGIHGAGDEGGLEVHSFSDGGIEHDLGGREADVARQQQEVVVGQTAMFSGIHKLMEIKAIAALVLVKHLQGGSVVKDLGRAVDSGRHLGSEVEEREDDGNEVEGVATSDKLRSN